MRCLYIALLACAFPANAQVIPTPDDHSVCTCRKNLNVIYEALQAYQKKHHDYPSKGLSELVPEFLADPSTLFCPKALKAAENDSGFESFIDVSDATSSYFYEYAATSLATYMGRAYSLREFKKAQREASGNHVPLLRCFRHDRVLNIDFNGHFSKGSDYWEWDYLHIRSMPYLNPPLLFQYPRPLQTYLPKRKLETPSHPDLAPYINALLGDPWLNPNQKCPVPNLKPGIITTPAMVKFDLRGVIQLQNSDDRKRLYPDQVELPINQTTKSIHLLVGISSPAILKEPNKITCQISTAKHPSITTTLNLVDTLPRPRDTNPQLTLAHLEIKNPNPQIPLTSIQISASEASLAIFSLTLSN